MPKPGSRMFDYDAWFQWLQSLDRAYLFLAVLPFVVIVVGLWSKYSNSTKDKRDGRR
jgi:hypothetical protein